MKLFDISINMRIRADNSVEAYRQAQEAENMILCAREFMETLEDVSVDDVYEVIDEEEE